MGNKGNAKSVVSIFFFFFKLDLWASLVAQSVKNLPAVQKTRVRSLGWEDPLEKDMATTIVFLPGESHGQRSLVGCSLWGCKELGMIEWLTLTYYKEGRINHSVWFYRGSEKETLPRRTLRKGLQIEVNGRKSWARREVESGWPAGQQAQLVSWELYLEALNWRMPQAQLLHNSILLGLDSPGLREHFVEESLEGWAGEQEKPTTPCVFPNYDFNVPWTGL